jgi:hypothetical protein
MQIKIAYQSLQMTDDDKPIENNMVVDNTTHTIFLGEDLNWRYCLGLFLNLNY